MSSRNEANSPDNEHNRRGFLKLGALAGLGATLGGVSVSGCTATGRRLRPAPAESFAAPALERGRLSDR